MAGCAKDDGADTRNCGGSSGSASGSTSGSTSGSGATDCADTGSGSSLSEDDVKGTSDDPLVNQAVTQYQAYVEQQVKALQRDAKAFTDAVRAGDVATAKARYAPSRVRWERIEPVAGLIANIDAAVDSRAEDGADPKDDPKIRGWHQLEWDLWVKGDLKDSKERADDLDTELKELEEGLGDLEVTPLAVAKGASELIEEAADAKLTGEEERYSHTDLWDLAANVEGAKAATDLLLPAIRKADPKLAGELDDAFAKAEAALEPHRRGDGWVGFDTLSKADRAALKARFAKLAEELGEVPGALKLS